MEAAEKGEDVEHENTDYEGHDCHILLYKDREWNKIGWFMHFFPETFTNEPIEIQMKN